MIKTLTLIIFIVLSSYSISQDRNINQTDSLKQKVGTWIEYNTNGSIKSVKEYKTGKLEGVCYFFDTLGKIQVISEFKNGLNDGDYRAFHPNGQLYLNIKSRKGKRVHYYQYSETNELVMEELYNENGKSTKTIHYKDGQVIAVGKTNTPPN